MTDSEVERLKINYEDIIQTLQEKIELREKKEKTNQNSCFNCRFLKFESTNYSTDEEDAFCKIHQHNLNDMFDIDLDLSTIGCKQFEQK